MANRLTPDQMVSIKAVAPFEVAEAMALWTTRARASMPDRELTADDEEASKAWANGLGPPTPLMSETAREFGERAAFAIFTLLKEI